MLLERFNVEKDETRGGTTPPAQSERKTALFPGGSAFPLLTKKMFHNKRRAGWTGSPFVISLRHIKAARGKNINSRRQAHNPASKAYPWLPA